MEMLASGGNGQMSAEERMQQENGEIQIGMEAIEGGIMS